MIPGSDNCDRWSRRTQLASVVKPEARRMLAWSFLALAPLAGCLVSASRYDQAVTEANLARDDSSRARQQLRALRAQLATMGATLQTRGDECGRTRRGLAQSSDAPGRGNSDS